MAKDKEMDIKPMMSPRLPNDISIIIVSYNNSDLLMLTLASVRRSVEGLKAEVIVVDNGSQDDTLSRLRSETPWVKVIDMGRNAGFSAANNEAMKQCTGHIVLILNPDTVLPRGTAHAIMAHFDDNPGCGAMGVRMVNGEGRYLGESKRGYTSISASFFKLSGLWRLAPKSRTLNAYYIGHCPERGVCHAPILSGACMAFNHDMIDQAGYFDDTYFMYSEDIDLSWRMDQTSSDGNSYRGDISIIHFKGQSTPRDKKYIGYFYDSMLLFAAKFEFPKHGQLMNKVTAAGIRVAYYIARLRSSIQKKREKRRKFAPPQRVLTVRPDDTDVSTPGKTTTFAKLAGERAEDYDAVVFDIDGDMGAAIEYMRKNERRTMFGFHNPDNGDTLIYFNNGCHKI